MTHNKQTLLLNTKAKLLDSCDSLFVLDNYKNQIILPFFPFLESVFDDLLDRLQVEQVIVFPGVETKHVFLPGYYDYVFSFVHQYGQVLIQWQIFDATNQYNKIKSQQQSRNEQKAFPKQDLPNNF